MSKPPAKVAAASKAPTKTAAKVVVKPTAAAPKAAPKTASVHPAKTVVEALSTAVGKPVVKPVAEPVVKTVAAVPAVKAAVKLGAASVKIAAPAPKAAAKSASAAPVPQPAPAPMTNRFTDRFAPAAKPAARQMTETAELPKPVQKIDPKLANAWKNKAGRELTEAELLAMPEPEYMNDKQLDFFRVRLQQQKDDLLSSAGETTEHLREDTSIVPDPVDRATIEEEHALELRTRDRERKLLKKIAQSLTRLETGEYGFCDETGEPIGLQRLMARPTATLSLEAQQRRELKQKMFGD